MRSGAIYAARGESRVAGSRRRRRTAEWTALVSCGAGCSAVRLAPCEASSGFTQRQCMGFPKTSQSGGNIHCPPATDKIVTRTRRRRQWATSAAAGRRGWPGIAECRNNRGRPGVLPCVICCDNRWLVVEFIVKVEVGRLPACGGKGPGREPE